MAKQHPAVIEFYETLELVKASDTMKRLDDLRRECGARLVALLEEHGMLPDNVIRVDFNHKPPTKKKQ